ncbi:uncharacterized protein LOC135991016 [Caloenas nicobarica]|uniref:uncharacterized protein LOC135991016 n=1 Tax=Caloenas nicobarica TaxID=187106 RepID=UPI0032B74C19
MSRMKAAESRMEKDTEMIQDALGLESTGGQSAPAKPPQLDTENQRGASSALGPKGPGTEPVPRTSKGTPGTQPGSLGMQEGAQRTPAPTEKWTGAPSDQTRTSDASTTMAGMQPGSSKQDPAVPWEALASTLNSGYHVQVMEIPWHLRHLDSFYITQKHRVEQLTKNKLDRAEFEKQHQILLERGQQSMARVLADLQSKVSSLQGWVSSLQGMVCELQDVKQEVRQLEEAFGKLGLAGADGKAGSSDQTPLQLEHHRLAGAQADVVTQPPLLGTRALPTPPAPVGWIGTLRTGQDWGVQPKLKGPETASVPRTSKGTPRSQPGSQGMQEGTQRTPASPAKWAGAPSEQTRMSDASVSMPGMQPASSKQEPGTTWEELELSCTLDSLYQVQLLEFKSHLGHLDDLFGILMNRVDQLTDTKLDRAELRKLRRLLPRGGQQSMVHILANLQSKASSVQSQVSSLQALECELQHVKQEVRQLEEAFGKLGLAGADGKAGSSDQTPLQLGHHRLAGAQADVVIQPPLPGTRALPTPPSPPACIGTPRTGQDWGSPAEAPRH